MPTFLKGSRHSDTLLSAACTYASNAAPSTRRKWSIRSSVYPARWRASRASCSGSSSSRISSIGSCAKAPSFSATGISAAQYSSALPPRPPPIARRRQNSHSSCGVRTLLVSSSPPLPPAARAAAALSCASSARRLSSTLGSSCEPIPWSSGAYSCLSDVCSASSGGACSDDTATAALTLRSVMRSAVNCLVKTTPLPSPSSVFVGGLIAVDIARSLPRPPGTTRTCSTITEASSRKSPTSDAACSHDSSSDAERAHGPLFGFETLSVSSTQRAMKDLRSSATIAGELLGLTPRCCRPNELSIWARDAPATTKSGRGHAVAAQP